MTQGVNNREIFDEIIRDYLDNCFFNNCQYKSDVDL